MKAYKIYIVTISGNRFCFCGDLMQNQIEEMDQYCKNAEKMIEHVDKDINKVFADLMEYLREKMGCDVKRLIPDHIFRINL